MRGAAGVVAAGAAVALAVTVTETLVVTAPVAGAAAAAAGAAVTGVGAPPAASARTAPSGAIRIDVISLWLVSSSTKARPPASMRSTRPGDPVPARTRPLPSTASERTWAVPVSYHIDAAPFGVTR